MLGQREQALRAKRNRVGQFLKNRKVPHDLRARVRENFELQFRLGMDEPDSDILQELSPPLRRAVLYHLHRPTFEAVPVLRHAAIGLQLKVAEHFVNVIALAREYLLIAGEAGSDMYFIKSGSIVVVALDGTIVRSLERGSFFGEQGLLERTPCAESYRCVVDSELLQLSRDSFLDILIDFPGFEQSACALPAPHCPMPSVFAVARCATVAARACVRVCAPSLTLPHRRTRRVQR